MFEKVILQNIINNKKFGVEFAPFLQNDYFEFTQSKLIFRHVAKYLEKYKSIPHWNEILIEMGNDKELNEDMYAKVISYVNEIKPEEDYNIEWLENETKKWVKERAFSNVITEASIRIGEKMPVDDMMEKMQKALAINFNDSIGNSFFRDYEKQHDFYTAVKDKFESNLTTLNLVCDGGVERKTLNLIVAPTNTGKTSAMVSLASGYLRRGYNVLYITCEMAEENIRQRVDANFLRTPINDIPKMDKLSYCNQIKNMATMYKSNLYVKEYPTAFASVNHIRALLDSLQSKEGFIPDIVFVDYLNIMVSVRLKGASLYETGKAIAEEVRGLACQYNMAFWSATQTNRGGEGASDLNLEDISDSYGVPMTMDLVLSIIQTPALLEQGKQLWKINKNRYSDLKNYKFGVEHDFKTCTVSDAETTNNTENSDDMNVKANKVNNTERMKALEVSVIDWS